MNTYSIDFYIRIAALWAAAIFVLAGCSGESGNAAGKSESRLIPAVEAVQSGYGSLPLTERLTGEVKAKNQIEIYPEISAPVTAVYVRNGDLVKAGQPLVQLRDKEFAERLKQARANLQITQAQAKQAEARLKEISAALKRTETLAQQELASAAELEAAQTRAVSAEAELELAEARVAQAKATVDERRQSLQQTTVRAPISGTVGNRNAEVGMLAESNMRLFTLGKLENVEVEVVLTDRMLSYIEKGQRTEIAAEYEGFEQLSAPLTRISPFLNPVTHSTVAEIDMANPDGLLKPGMFVTVDIFYGESEQATLVPQSALFENPTTGVTGVYVARDTINAGQPTLNPPPGDEEPISLTPPVTFEFVQVEVIAEGRMSVGVRGVDAGDWVVTLGQHLFGGAEGEARVRVVQWPWVEQLQKLQRQDLLEEVFEQNRRAAGKDTTSSAG